MSKKCDELQLMKLLEKYTDGDYNITSDDYILTNWNNIPRGLTDYIEEHWETDWTDMATTCTECGKYIRLVPMYHGWVPQHYRTTDGYPICRECCLNQPDYILDDLSFYADSLPVYVGACQKWLKPELEKAGYAPFNSEHSLCKDVFESGFHVGQTDTPQKVAKLIEETLGGLTKVIFMIDDSGQFDIHFSAYVKLEGADED